MDIELKGDLNGLSKQQLELVKNVLKEQKFEGRVVTIEAFGKAGDNIASELKIIKINNEGEVISIIAKITQNISRSLNELNTVSHMFFNNEIIMYTEVLPMLVQLQKSSGISACDCLQYATCYSASKVTAHEIILLEDLTMENYVTLDKFKPLSNKTIKLVLQSLAQYHSLSYILRVNAPDIFAEFCKKIVAFVTSKVAQKHTDSFKVLGHNFSQLFDNRSYKNIIIDTFNQYMDRLLRLTKSDEGSKYSVIIHGDCWTNNFLFQLQDGQPTKCIMIDYQQVRESMPVVDVLHLIFNCTDYESRSKHYYDWLDYYHSQLDKYLSAYGLKINHIYPKDKFDSDLKRYSKICLAIAIFSASLLARKNEEAAKIKEAYTDSDNMSDMLSTFKVTDLETESIIKIKIRIEELINSFIDFGYLNTKNYV